jgi:hypothetical protein
MVNLRRQRLKAIRVGIDPEVAAKTNSQAELIKLMEENQKKKENVSRN